MSVIEFAESEYDTAEAIERIAWDEYRDAYARWVKAKDRQEDAWKRLMSVVKPVVEESIAGARVSP